MYLGSSSIFLVCCLESGIFLGVGGSFFGVFFLSLDVCLFFVFRVFSIADVFFFVFMVVFVRIRFVDRGRLDGFFWFIMFCS